MMRSIQTVTGLKAASQISFCHYHEHLMISKGTPFSIDPNLCINDYAKTLSELKSFADAGGSTIVDAQPVGCSRMAGALAKLEKDSGLHIIASTGFHKMMFYPGRHWVFRNPAAKLSELFLHEISTGMYINCDNNPPEKWIDARAGVIKCAFDTCGLTDQYRKLFDAATFAAKQTHLPLMIHIEQGSAPLELVRYLDKRDINPSRVIFCHMDRACPDVKLHKEICRQGIYLGYDTIGRFKYHDDNHEARIFMELVASGCEDQLLFSLDTTRERLKSYNPSGVGLTYILNTFIPLLKEYGITNAQIHKFACQNPQNILSLPEAP